MIAYVIVTVLLTAATAVGTVLLARALPRFLRVKPVKIEVVGNDETKTAGESPSLAFAPIFRVIEGAHDGKEWRSNVVAGPAPQYRIGDRLDGWLDPKSGEIHTSGTKHAYWALTVLLLTLGYGGFACRILT